MGNKIQILRKQLCWVSLTNDKRMASLDFEYCNIINGKLNPDLEKTIVLACICIEWDVIQKKRKQNGKMA